MPLIGEGRMSSGFAPGNFFAISTRGSLAAALVAGSAEIALAANTISSAKQSFLIVTPTVDARSERCGSARSLAGALRAHDDRRQKSTFAVRVRDEPRSA